MILQKQPSRGVLQKRCSENMQQIYRRPPMPKCDFNKAALQGRCSEEHLWTAASHTSMIRLNDVVTIPFLCFRSSIDIEGIRTVFVLYFSFMKDILNVKNANKSTSSNFYLYNIHKQKHFK